jgi:hypothetical protein
MTGTVFNVWPYFCILGIPQFRLLKSLVEIKIFTNILSKIHPFHRLCFLLAGGYLPLLKVNMGVYDIG